MAFMKRFTKDSTLSWFLSQLGNLDKKLYEPLVSTTWGRDIKLRQGITLALESVSFQRAMFGGDGSMKNGGMPWINPATSTLKGVSVDGELVTTPLRLLGRELTYSSVELERSQFLGQPIDVRKLNALNTLYQMSTDEMVYVGSDEVNAKGLVNSDKVTIMAASIGSGGGTTFATKTVDEILADIDTLLNATWTASAYAVCPDKLLIDPKNFSLLVSRKVSEAGNDSVLTYLSRNTIANNINGRPLDIQPLKWLVGRGEGSTPAAPINRMVAYTNDEDRVRFPMVPIRREMPYYLSINFHAPYIWAYGEVEFVYPETIRYMDGI